MNSSPSDILIIGAGLTGLTVAYLLRNEGLAIRILEARPRLGGRILTLRKEGYAPIEAGATWLGAKHSALFQLLNELNIDTYEQIMGETAIYEPISTSPPQMVQLPPNDNPSFRIKGGTDLVISRLINQVENKISVHLDQKVKRITLHREFCSVETTTKEYKAKYVISTLPPYLVSQTLEFTPVLPRDLEFLMHQTHTWMGESIKFGLHFSAPFWQRSGLSGTLVSNVGPVPEMYDHSDFERQSFALMGFLNGAYFSLTKKERKEIILRQMSKYYGRKINEYTRYDEKVWAHEVYTYTPYHSHILPHQNNGHPLYQKSYWEGRLFIAGSETAMEFPGYMDGAVRSAQYVADKLRQQ